MDNIRLSSTKEKHCQVSDSGFKSPIEKLRMSCIQQLMKDPEYSRAFTNQSRLLVGVLQLRRDNTRHLEAKEGILSGLQQLRRNTAEYSVAKDGNYLASTS